MHRQASKVRALGRLFGPGRQMPVYLLQFVTTRCDAKCDHCFYWRELNSKVRDELSLDEFDRIAQSLGPLLQVTLTGGSPELRRDLPEIAEIYYRRCQPVNMTICMNGYHTQRIVDHVKAILDRCPEQILTCGLSLDGLEEEHDGYRHMPGLFQRLRETIHQLAKLRDQVGSRMRISVALTVSGLNFPRAEETARWVRENLPVDLFKPILVRGDPKLKQAHNQLCGEAYGRLVMQDDLWINGRVRQGSGLFDRMINAKESVQRDLIREISTHQNSPVRCAGGRQTIVIYPHGELAGCEMIDQPIGLLREQDYDVGRILASEAAKRFRAEVGQRPECQGCYHHCFHAPPVFRSPKMLPKLATAAAGFRTASPATCPADAP